MIRTRRVLTFGLLGLTVLAAKPASAQTAAPVTFMTAGDGSAFLPYGQGMAAYLARKDIRVEIKKSGGSNDNLMAVSASAMTIGTAFMASAYEAITGTGLFAGHKHDNVRALFPMYETSFQVAALRNSGLRSLADLDGKKVGVGPARGPAEGFFRAAAEVAGIRPVIVNGDPAALSKLVLIGEIDALWQGAVVPIPSLTAVADQADAVVFGLSDTEVAAVLAKLPALAHQPRFSPALTRDRPPRSKVSPPGISWSPTRTSQTRPLTRSPRRSCRQPIPNPKSIRPLWAHERPTPPTTVSCRSIPVRCDSIARPASLCRNSSRRVVGKSEGEAETLHWSRRFNGQSRPLHEYFTD